ncbi:MAG: hypothetical protein ACRDTF_09160, partial [Pseudonocardiaceae bacterium]
MAHLPGLLGSGMRYYTHHCTVRLMVSPLRVMVMVGSCRRGPVCQVRVSSRSSPPSCSAAGPVRGDADLLAVLDVAAGVQLQRHDHPAVAGQLVPP